MSPKVGVNSKAQGCSCYNSASQAIPTGVWTYINFNGEGFDTDKMHDLVINPYQINAPTPGVYLATAFIQFAANNTGYRGLIIRLGTGQSVAEQYTRAIQDDVTSLSATGIWRFTSAGQSVRALAYQNSGGDLDILVTSLIRPYFSLQRIG